MHIYLYSRAGAGARAGVGAVVGESQLELKPALQPGHMSSSNKYLCTFVWVCVCVWWAHVFVVLVSACLHVCVELKKYDILSVKQALCQTNSHWLHYKRGIATLSCLPPSDTPTSLQLQSSLACCPTPSHCHHLARIGIWEIHIWRQAEQNEKGKTDVRCRK